MNLPGIYLPYAAISNDNAPSHVVEQFKKIAMDMETRGYTMRTSGNKGVEEIIESLVSNKEVHVAWKGFNQRETQFTRVDKAAIELVGTLHPAFNDLKDSVKTIIARYAHVILGKDLKSPVRCVVCWTEDGAESAKEVTSRTGVVGHVIILCQSLSIPIHNLVRDNVLIRIEKLLGIELG